MVQEVMTISTMRDGGPTSSNSRGFVSWILSNVVRPAFTRVVLRVRPWEEGSGGGWQYIKHAYATSSQSQSHLPYQSCPAVLKHAWNFPTACRYNNAQWYVTYIYMLVLFQHSQSSTQHAVIKMLGAPFLWTLCGGSGIEVGHTPGLNALVQNDCIQQGAEVVSQQLQFHQTWAHGNGKLMKGGHHQVSHSELKTYICTTWKQT